MTQLLMTKERDITLAESYLGKNTWKLFCNLECSFSSMSTVYTCLSKGILIISSHFIMASAAQFVEKVARHLKFITVLDIAMSICQTNMSKLYLNFI